MNFPLGFILRHFHQVNFLILELTAHYKHCIHSVKGLFDHNSLSHGIHLHAHKCNGSLTLGCAVAATRHLMDVSSIN